LFDYIQNFVSDDNIAFFHIGKASADSAEKGIYNRWSHTYSWQFSGMIVLYEDQDSEQLPRLWNQRKTRQEDLEKQLHRLFNKNLKWRYIYRADRRRSTPTS